MFGGAAEESDTVSMKGIKAEAALAVTGGTLTLDAADAMPAQQRDRLGFSGTITARTGDDGHPCRRYAYDQRRDHRCGELRGRRGGRDPVTGGTIDVTASDDGL